MPVKILEKRQSNAGLTLIEIIIVLALLGIVTSFLMTFVNFSTASENKVEDEYVLQADVRLATEKLNNAIRESSVTFAIPGEVFFSNKKAKWNYFGIDEETGSIVQFIYNEEKSKDEDKVVHDKIVIVEAREGISFNLYFIQNIPGSNLIEYHLDVVDDTGDRETITIVSEIEAMNSLVVDDKGSGGRFAEALAYRNDPTPRPEDKGKAVTINVALVLDDSGSMKEDMHGRKAGTTGFDPEDIRIDIMKREARKLIDKFANLGIKVAIIPFSTTADNPGDIMDAKAYKVELKKKINSLKAEGGTNTGDAMRRAYYQLSKFQPISGKAVNYMILLTDGDPTYRTGENKKGSGSYRPRTDDGNTGSSNYVWGDGNNDGRNGAQNLKDCMAYCEVIGQKITSDKTLKIGSFVIGFSAVESDIGNNETIAKDYCNGTYYEAADGLALESAFNGITRTILEETWHIYGPY